MIREFFEKRRLARQFAKYVDPEKVEAILRTVPKPGSPKAGRVEYVIVFVRGESVEQVSARVGRVVDIAVAQVAVVNPIVGNLVIMVFGVFERTPETGNRLSLVKALQGQLGADIKIVHGAADGHYGLFGSQSRMSYTFLVPQFDRILGTLSELEFGMVKEIELT